MKTYAQHKLFDVAQQIRCDQSFWVSREQLAAMEQQNEETNEHYIDVLDQSGNYIKIRLRNKDLFGKEFFMPPLIRCSCGHKGNGVLRTQTLPNSSAETTWYEVSCICGNTMFDYTFAHSFTKLVHADLYHDEKKITLSFSLQTYKKRNGKISSFNDNLRLTYNPVKRMMYWVQPAKRKIKNMTYGNMNSLENWFLQTLLSTSVGFQAFYRFVELAFQKTSIHPVVATQAMESLLIKKEQGVEQVFGTTHTCWAKATLPLLFVPQLSFFNEEFRVSFAKAPQVLKRRIRNTPFSKQDIISGIFQGVSERLLSYLGDDTHRYTFVYALQSLVKDGDYLLDIAESVQNPSGFFAQRPLGDTNRFVATRWMSYAHAFRKEGWGALAKIRTSCADDRSFRDTLLTWLHSPNIAGDMNTLVSYLEEGEKKTPLDTSVPVLMQQCG